MEPNIDDQENVITSLDFMNTSDIFLTEEDEHVCQDISLDLTPEFVDEFVDRPQRKRYRKKKGDPKGIRQLYSIERVTPTKRAKYHDLVINDHDYTKPICPVCPPNKTICGRVGFKNYTSLRTHLFKFHPDFEISTKRIKCAYPKCSTWCKTSPEYYKHLNLGHNIITSTEKLSFNLKEGFIIKFDQIYLFLIIFLFRFY